LKKNKLLKYLLGFSALVFLFLAISTTYLFNRQDSLKLSAERIQQVFNKKERLLKKDLRELQNGIGGGGSLSKYENFSEFEKDLKKDGFVLLGMKQDSLVFWSDNSFILPRHFDLKSISSPVVRMPNGWYFVQKNKQDSIDLYGLLLLKKIYPYQNKFLRNSFDEEFKTPAKYSISLDKESGEPIFDNSGKYLFSLTKGDFGFEPEKVSNKIGALFAAFFCVLLIFLSVLIRDIRNVKLGFTTLAVYGIVLFLSRYFMLLWSFPSVLSELELFSPLHFASSFFFPSLGDFVINVLFLYAFVYTYSAYSLKNNISKGLKQHWCFIYIICHVLLFWILYCWSVEQIGSLVVDSSFSLQMFVFQDKGIYVFTGFVILILLLYSLGHFAYLIGEMAKHQWSRNKYFAFLFLISVPAGIISYFFEAENKDVIFFLFPVVLLLFTGFVAYREDKNGKYSFFILLLLLVSIAINNQINVFSEKKEVQNRLVAAMNLSTEYDPTSENLLVDMQSKMDIDIELRMLCNRPFRNEMQIMKHIQNKYFSGFWEQYHLQVTICNDSDDLNIEPDNEIRNCFDFFQEMILKSGESIPNTNFYYLNEFDGMVSYLGVITSKSLRNESVKIYIRLDSKVGDEGLGYPDLLLDEKVALRKRNTEYSFAKYSDGKLITSSGAFTYYMNSKVFDGKKDNTYRLELDGYDHLVYKFENNTVVVSYQAITWYNKAITIPYLFVLFYLFGLIIWLFEKYPWRFKFNMSFKYRIQYSIVGLLMIFFLLLGGGTVYYTIERSKELNNQKLQDKLELVKREVILSLNNDINVDFLSDRLQRLSSLIYADIHLYDPSGRLITSSRPEIFEKNLQNTKMNFAAYFQLFFQEKTKFIHHEEIGSMSYLSAYESIVNEDNELIAFVNLPYFLKSQDLEKEMFNLVLAGVNLHVFMILFAIFLSVFISNKITYPLRMIQNKLKATRFGSYGDKIEYTKDDEIGNLVNEYNQMLTELEESAELLARSERESAWREMARQIAHEIKNPLTPMKLSIQFMQKRFEEKSENREEHLKQVSKTLIEQINALSSIATAFSNFAKMPTAKNEQLNLIDILQHVISLFRNDSFDLKLQLNDIENADVFVDREQFVRVFVNLINNAIQSIPDDREGQIVIEIEEQKEYYQASVIDNGLGIKSEVKEKLFYPNFTTKSGGMGLGLAIVKNIVENAKGKIWVESEENVGSCFFVKIPKYKL